jgi:excisionase family DNA binding protein
LISVRTAALLASCSRDHIYDLINRGDLEAYRVGNSTGPIRLVRDEFTAWLFGTPERNTNV